MRAHGVVVVQADDVRAVLRLEHELVVADGEPAAEVEGGAVGVALDGAGCVGEAGGALERFAPVGAYEDAPAARHAGEQLAVEHAGAPFVVGERGFGHGGAEGMSALFDFDGGCAVFAGVLWGVGVCCAADVAHA